MSITMDEFANRLDSFAISFPKAVNQLVRLTALETLKNIVIATPRDIGRAASNWFISVHTPSDEISDDTEVDENLVEQSGKILSPTVSNIIWLSNNLPYIVRLNDGWSKQTASGFVERGIAAAERSIGKLASKIKF